MTFVIQGSFTHKGSIGTEETLGRGGVQFITVGTGIRHSELGAQLAEHSSAIHSVLGRSAPKRPSAQVQLDGWQRRRRGTTRDT